jgi:hypothetical protein
MIEFSERGLRTLVERAREQGYEFIAPGQPAERGLILRHDVDLSLRSAARLAELEAELGVSSTYFIMVTSPFYGVMSPQARSLLQAIVRCGHRIGLHWDAGVHADGDLAPAETVAREIDLLEWLTATPCVAVSHHQPSLHGLAEVNLPGVVNMYSAQVQANFAYVSDSCMAWRRDPLAVIAEGEPLHLLLHPEYWVPGGANLDAVVAALIDEEIAEGRGRLLGELALMNETVARRASFDGELRKAMEG